MSDYYNRSGSPSTSSSLSSAVIRGEFTAISAGFDKLPNLNASVVNQIVVVNPSGTGLTTQDASALTFNNVPITFSNINSSSANNVSMTRSNFNTGTLNNVTVAASSLNNVTITNSNFNAGVMNNVSATRSNFNTGTINNVAITSSTITGTTVNNAAVTNLSATSSNFNAGILNNVTITRSNFNTGTLNNVTLTSATVNSNFAVAGIIDISNNSAGTAGNIKFPATQNDSSDANTLDDYEEGSWTPNMGFGSTTSFNSRSGTYVKVGKLVYLYAAVDIATIGNGNAFVMSGAPFVSGGGGGGAVFNFANLNTNVASLTAVMSPGGAAIVFSGLVGNSNNQAAVLNNVFKNGTVMEFSLQYTA